jgi:hypothetical protein
MHVKRRLNRSEVVAVRIQPRFKRILEQLAYNEGLDLSAWMRNLIIKELKDRGVMRETAITAPALEGLEPEEG